MNTQRITLALAAITTAVGVVMAGVAAAEQAGTRLDVALMVAVAVVVALGAHMLPALAGRRWAAWLLWVGCLLATLYGHSHFFTTAGQRAGAERAGAVAASSKSAELRAELGAIKARPLAEVAAAQAQAVGKLARAEAALAQCEAKTPGKCLRAGAAVTVERANVEALAVESGQAKRATELRALLAAEAALQDAGRAVAAADPVDAKIAQLTGVQAASVGFVMSLAKSLIVEMMAALLWAIALKPAATADEPAQVEAAPVRRRRKTAADAAPVADAPASASTAAPQPKARDRPSIREWYKIFSRPTFITKEQTT